MSCGLLGSGFRGGEPRGVARLLRLAASHFQAGELVAQPVSGGIGDRELVACRRDEFGDLGEFIGGALQLGLALGEFGDASGDRLPVESVVARVGVQTRQRVPSIHHQTTAVLEVGDLGVDPVEIVLDPLAGGEERVDLLFVAPPEHVIASVVDALRIVLLVPTAAGADLTGRGDRVVRVSELVERLRADVSRTLEQATFEPGGERTVFDVEFVSEGIRRRSRRMARRNALRHFEVHEAPTEMIGVDPGGDPIVQVGRHQQRQTESAEHALGGALPPTLVGPDSDEFTDEGQLLVRETDSGADQFAHPQTALGNVAGPVSQAGDLTRDASSFTVDLTTVHDELGDRVGDVGDLRVEGVDGVGHLTATSLELSAVGHRCQTGVVEQTCEPLVRRRTLLALSLRVDDLRLQRRDVVAAQPGLTHLQLAQRDPEIGDVPVDVLERAARRGEISVGLVEFGLEQLVPLVCEVVAESTATLPHLVGHLDVARVLGVVGQQWIEFVELAAREDDRVVRGGQVLEMGDHRVDPTRLIERFEHVIADEVVEVADCLHRHRLVEQFHRLLGPHGQAAPIVAAVLGEVLVDARPAVPQSLAERSQVGPELGEVDGDVHGSVGDGEEPLRLTAVVAHREDLREGDRLVVPLVGEDPQDHRVVRHSAQRDRTGGPGRVVALGLVVTEHVRTQVTLTGLGSGGLVVGDAVRGHQQCGERVDECRLARADVAGQQAVLAVQLERPHPLIERSPVEHLKLLQPEAGARRLRALELGRGEQPGHRVSSRAISTYSAR